MIVEEYENLCVIVMKNCQELGAQVNKELKKIRKTQKNYLIEIDEVRFNNTEGKIKINSSDRKSVV